MAGIYIHIPFCRKACHYCNFHFSTSLHQKQDLVAAIEREISFFPTPAGITPQREIHTVYFGGGTPSILTVEEISSLLKSIRSHFTITDGAELTLEANPDDINETKLETWKQLGINRLSIGVQSFVQADLEWMNRAHKAEQAIEAIKLAKSFGFNNLTIDLIYGTPRLSDSQWMKNLETAAALGIDHLSCYALTVEEKTALHYFIQKGQVAPVDEEKQSSQFEMLMDWAEQEGFEHYEISNFARAGNVSRHNSNYWSGDAYYGFGAAAHSFDGNKTRWWNIPNNRLYTDAMMKNETAFSFEILSEKQRLDERIMTGLRTKKGFDLEQLEAAINSGVITGEELSNFRQQVKRYIDEAFIINDGNAIVLTRRGIHYADGIAAALFF